MKKKLLSLIAVSAALATAGSVLIACGGGDKGSAKTDVTKEQWVAAMAVDSFASNFKAEVKNVNKDATESYNLTFIAGSEKYGDYSMTMAMMTGETKTVEQSMIRKVGTERDTFYSLSSHFDEDENKFVVGEWKIDDDKHVEYTAKTWEEGVLSKVGFNYIVALAKNYDDFAYGDGAYKTDKNIVLSEDIDVGDGYSTVYKMTANNITLKFADGKLVYIEMAMKSESEFQSDYGEPQKYEDDSNCTIKISYGTQTITAPEVPEKDKHAVTQSEWDSAMSVESFYNVTVKSTEKYNGGERVHNFKFDYSNNAYYSQSSNEERITTFHKDGVDGKDYEKISGEWQMTADDVTLSIERKIERMLEEVFLCEYEDFSYDNGVYYGANLHFADLSSDNFDITAEFEYGRLVEFEMTNKTDNTAINFIFSDYDSTTIEVPDVADTDITGEQWAAALSLGSFESNFKATVLTVNENEMAQQEYVFIAGANKYGDYYMSRTLSSLTGEKRRESLYIRIVGTEKDAYYDRTSRIEEVENEDGEWVDGDWKEGTWTVAYEDHREFGDEQWMRNMDNIGLSYIFLFADKYDSFEYENGAYVLKGNEGIIIDEGCSEPDYDYSYSYTITATGIVLQFVDGKLASVELTLTEHFESTENGETETSDIVFTVNYELSYGTQNIDVPEDAIPDGEDE
ncbi:MAG: hypothetical protein K2J01_08140 [Clostridiales bacterium]|nr:hypothetical protein [Clostridiales bacterium]